MFKGWHRPTVVTTLVGVVVLLLAYHLCYGRKGSSDE